MKLENRNQGVGAKLMKEGFEKAKEMGYYAAFLLGDPNYYQRFGFQEVGKFGIENATGLPEKHVLGCEIIKGALDEITGKIENLG